MPVISKVTVASFAASDGATAAIKSSTPTAAMIVRVFISGTSGRRLYRAPAFARAAFWDDVLGTSKKPKSAKTLADGLTVPTDLVGSPAPFRSVVSVLWLCGSGGCFAVEPRTDQRSDDDLYQAYRKADGQNMSREKMECNRHDRSQQIPKAPDGCTGTERRFCPGAVARAYRSIEPDGEDAHQKTPGQEHQKCAAPHLPAQGPHCCIHIFGQYEAVQSEFKHVDDYPGEITANKGYTFV